MSWFACLLIGLFSGFSEFLPISSEAHMILLGRLFGMEEVGSGIRLAVHLGSLLALLLACRPQISRLTRENRIASIPPRKRKRQPDTVCLLDWRVLKSAAFLLLLGFIAYPWVGKQGARLWILGIGLVANGIVLYVPQFIARGNKNARTITRIDALLIGLSGSLGVLPGVSRVGTVSSAASICGCDREYAVHLSLLLSVPALFVLTLLDLAGLIAFGLSGASFAGVFGILTAGIMSFISGYFGVMFVRFLSVKAGFSAFAYYSWGAALFAFILYLAI